MSGKNWTVGGKTVVLTYTLDESSAQAFAAQFVKSVIKNLDGRFADAGLLYCFRIFDPLTYKGMSAEARAKFGEDELEQLL